MGKWRVKGGGYIGRIESVTFEDKTWESENAKTGEYRTVTAKLMILKDGADEAIEQYLPAGFIYDGQGVSEDGKTLVDASSDDSAIVDGDSDFALFIDSIEANEGEDGKYAAAFAESNYRNFDILEGVRIEVKNEINKTRQIASGLKKLKAPRNTVANDDGTYTIKGKDVSEADVLKAGKRAGKGERKGQSFNQTRIVVTKVFGDAPATKAAAPAAAAKDAKLAKLAAKPVKGKPAAKVAEEEDDSDDSAEDTGPSAKEAAKFLKTLLDEEDGSFDRKDITVLVSRKIKDAAERKAMTAMLLDEDFLGDVEGVSYAVKGKAQTITLD